MEATMNMLRDCALLCATVAWQAAFAAGASAVYIPEKGDGWAVSGGTVELGGALISSVESSPKGFRFNRLQRGCGVIFKLATGKAEPIYDFSSHPSERGCRVGTELTVHGDGIYGVTSWGGYDNAGTIFHLTLDGIHRVVHRFNGSDGRTPASGIVQGDDGRLYGVTQFGGLHDRGTVFRIGKTGRLTTLHHFSDDDPLGEYPSEGLTIGPDRAAYGVARYGAKESGTIFKVEGNGQVSLVRTDGYTVQRFFVAIGTWGPCSACTRMGLSKGCTRSVGTTAAGQITT
jgi:uncharacterized repeat protein (TIGR03803 family)